MISGKEVDAFFFHRPEEPHGYLSNWYASPFDLALGNHTIILGEKDFDELQGKNKKEKQSSSWRNYIPFLGGLKG